MEVSTKRWICSDICRRCSDPCRFAGYVGEDEEGMETRFTDSSCGCQTAAASVEIIAAAARVILTLGLIPSAAVKTGAAAAGITADAKTDAVAGITAAVRTSAAVANVMHGMS